MYRLWRPKCKSKKENEQQHNHNPVLLLAPRAMKRVWAWNNSLVGSFLLQPRCRGLQAPCLEDSRMKPAIYKGKQKIIKGNLRGAKSSSYGCPHRETSCHQNQQGTTCVLTQLPPSNFTFYQSKLFLRLHWYAAKSHTCIEITITICVAFIEVTPSVP